jgi:hypothetical protein
MPSPTHSPSDQETPLLSSPAPNEEPAEEIEAASLARNKHIWRLCFTIFALVEAANVVLRAPFIQLREDSTCMAEYGTAGSLGEDCKVQAVQDEVTTLTQWQQLFDTGPGELLSFIYTHIS